MAGAQNVTIPNQTHVQACTSRESFVEYYEFLTGEEPAYADIVRQSGPIEVAGKALNFPENAGAVGTTVEVWPVDDNGERTSGSPLFSTLITDASTGGGAFGPVTVQAGQRYEFALINAAQQTIHIYYEPFVRSDYTLRLLQSNAIANAVGNRPGSASGVNIRYKELWGDQGSENDQLLIDGAEYLHPDAVPDQQAGQRVLRLRRQPRRPDRPELAGSRAQRAAVHNGRGRLHARRQSARRHDLPAAALTGNGADADAQHPELRLGGRGVLDLLERLREHRIHGRVRPAEGRVADKRNARPCLRGLCTSRPTPPTVRRWRCPPAAHRCSRSDHLTVGTPDANGKPPAAAGGVQLKVVGESPINPDNGDQSDVGVTASFTDVRNQAGLTDYTGELRAVLGVRTTDRYNGAALDQPATAADSTLAFNLSCAATAGSEGGTCNAATTLDAVTGGELVREGKRAVWELSQIQVFDGGADADADTTGDNTLFAVQGLFAP